MTSRLAAFRLAAGRAAELAGRVLVRLPGLGALACAVTGAYLLAGLGVALLVAAVLLLLVDRRMP